VPELTLLHPDRLWWLLLLPVLFWLALPPRPRRVAYSAHLPQWRHAMLGLRRRSPRALSLRTVLMLLAAACAVFAGLGLALAGRPGPERLVVLFDASASMGARIGNEGDTAFAQATERLQRTLATVPESVDVRVLRCGGALVRRHGRSARQLQDLGGPGGSRAVDLRELAASSAADDTAVWTVTDGQGAGELPTTGALSLFGERAPNAAVMAVRTVDHWPLPGLELEADVVLFAGANEAAVTVSLRGPVVSAPPQNVTLRSGEASTLSWSLTRTAAGGRLTVEVALPGDVLPADDRWSLLLPPLPAPRIAVLADAEAGPFATVAAEALAVEVGGSVVVQSAETEVGMLLVDGGEIALAPGTARALCFGSRFAGGEALGRGYRPQALDWDRSSPLCAGLDLSGLRVDIAHAEALPVGEPFLFAERGGERVPLAVVCGDDPASVHLAFRLQDSNLPLLAAFPQLLRRAFVRCYGDAARIQSLSAAPAAGEQDLEQRKQAEERPLPEFGTADVGLGVWLMLAGMAALLLRAFVK